MGMLRGSVQRGALAILMMVVMLAPFGACLQRTAKSAHSCCAMLLEQTPSQMVNCCVVKAKTPAAAVLPAVSGENPLQMVEQSQERAEIPSFHDVATTGVIPPLSPPTGAFNLRI